MRPIAGQGFEDISDGTQTTPGVDLVFVEGDR